VSLIIYLETQVSLLFLEFLHTPMGINAGKPLYYIAADYVFSSAAAPSI
jgi:hypothetical protein